MRTVRSGEDRALGGRGRRLNEPRGTLTPSRRGAREVWGNPPASLRGTMENASTGQMRSSNHPPACGAACARVRRSRFELDLTEKRTLPNRWVSECAFPSRRDRRMRLSVTSLIQNALFRRMRLSSPGQTWRRLTERRTLQPASHGKAHSTGAKTGPRMSKFLSSDRRAATLKFLCATAFWLHKLMLW